MRENCGVRGVVHQKIGKRFGTGTGTHYVLSKGEEYQNLEHIRYANAKKNGGEVSSANRSQGVVVQPRKRT